jgi:ribosome biogenesis GTPase A
LPEQHHNKFSWYPGHIAKAERELKEKIKAIDIIIELRDARIPLASSHRELNQWAGSKPIIVVLTKADLANPELTKSFCNQHKALNIDAKNPKTLKPLLQAIEKLAQPIIEKSLKKGISGKPVRIMVVGYPNVGKSTLINALSKTKKAKVENKPGVTKQQQWIDMPSKIPLKLLDTPGIIPPKFYSEDQSLKLALCNCVGSTAYDVEILAQAGMEFINKISDGKVQAYYGIPEISILSLAITKGLKVNKEPNLNKAAQMFINDFRDQKFGNLSLD